MIREVVLLKKDDWTDFQRVSHQISVWLLSTTDSEYNQKLSEYIKIIQSTKVELAAQASKCEEWNMVVVKDAGFLFLIILIKQIQVKGGMIVKQYLVSSEKRLLKFISALVVFIGILSACTLIPETDPERGATTVKQDQFGDNYTEIKYLEQ